MKIQEAINHAKEVAERNRKCNKNKECIDITCEKCAEEHEQLAEWLEELQKYRAIGTVEECREARERQRAKKPIKIAPCKSVNYFKCSSCGEFLSIGKPFCKECGNAVDWSGEID